MNALIEMTTLFSSRPSVEAAAEEVAAWYQAKARMHESLATRQAPAERARELRYAAAATEHARRLLTGANSGKVIPLPTRTPEPSPPREPVPVPARIPAAAPRPAPHAAPITPGRVPPRWIAA